MVPHADKAEDAGARRCHNAVRRGEAMPVNLEQARALLDTRKTELESEQAAGEEDRAPVELDQSSVGRVSRMDAIQGREMALASARRRATELGKIEAAFRRLDAGEYGNCVKCGEEIGDKRLALDPAAAMCVKCA
jgi:DnaK suppressor protein